MVLISKQNQISYGPVKQLPGGRRAVRLLGPFYGLQIAHQIGRQPCPYHALFRHFSIPHRLQKSSHARLERAIANRGGKHSGEKFSDMLENFGKLFWFEGAEFPVDEGGMNCEYFRQLYHRLLGKPASDKVGLVQQEPIFVPCQLRGYRDQDQVLIQSIKRVWRDNQRGLFLAAVR